MNSENATPMTLIKGNGYSVQLQEARVPGFFIPKNNSDLQHHHDQCECCSITKRDTFKLELNILIPCLAVNVPKAYSKFQNSQEFYPEHNEQ